MTGRLVVLWMLGAGWLASGCVVGAEQRPGASEARRPPREPSAADSAAALIDPAPAAEQGEPGSGRPGQVWVRGYWHWGGVRYVWVPGRWEPAQRAWRRSPR